MRKLWAAFFISMAALLFLGCDGSPTGPTSGPSPSPSPTPDPAVLCEVRRVDVIAEREDKGHVGDVVTAWPLGIVPTVVASPWYAGSSDPTFVSSSCRQFDVVTWGIEPDPGMTCRLLGNATAPRRPLQCFSGGFVTITAQPQGFNVPAGRVTFRVQG